MKKIIKEIYKESKNYLIFNEIEKEYKELKNNKK